MDWMEWSLLGIGAAALVIEIVGLIGRAMDKEWGLLISPTMRKDGRRWLFFPLLWGVLGGHFYGPVLAEKVPSGPILLAIIGALVLAIDLVEREYRPKAWLTVASCAGYVLGAVLWSQS